MRKFLSVIIAGTLLAGVAAHAQKVNGNRYKWVDPQGLPHYSDSLTAEAMKAGYDVVNDRGMVVQRVPRQLTAAERAVANKLAKEAAAKERARQDVARAEAQMMSAYPDEASYKMSLQQTVDALDQQIRTTRINLQSQEKALTGLLDRAAELEQAKQPVPKFMVDNISKQRNVVAMQRNALARQQAERDSTVAAQARQLARYRELKAAEDTPSGP
jgi:septal ring factor EnvC (AmiA/AmiB activator)